MGDEKPFGVLRIAAKDRERVLFWTDSNVYESVAAPALQAGRDSPGSGKLVLSSFWFTKLFGEFAGNLYVIGWTDAICFLRLENSNRICV